jgi:hypothetical protein
MANDLKQILQTCWMHSHEEDTADEMIFRPKTFAFPRSRGRTGFELKDGGELIETGIAPVDGKQISVGQWKMSDGGDIVFMQAGSSEPRRILKVVSASPERLVIKK